MLEFVAKKQFFNFLMLVKGKGCLGQQGKRAHPAISHGTDHQ